MVETGASIVRDTTSSTIWGSHTRLCTAYFTAVYMAALWKALTIDRFTTVRITDIILVSVPDSVARPALPDSHSTAFSTKAGKLAILSRTLSSGLADYRDRVDRVQKAGRSPDTGLSARPLNVSLPSAFAIGGATSCNVASNVRSATVRFPTTFAALDEEALRRSCQSKPSWLLTAAPSSSRLCRKKVIVGILLV